MDWLVWIILIVVVAVVLAAQLRPQSVEGYPYKKNPVLFLASGTVVPGCAGAGGRR